MYENICNTRVRYGETDQMGYVYYGNYAQFFEIGRVEAMRSLGMSYKDMEAEGIMLPVTEFNIKYLKPAFYDDELTIKTYIRKIPSVKIHFDYEIFNADGLKLCEAFTTLVFVSKDTMRPRSAPDSFIDKLKKYF
jgi:acyl-CoA thioester hydrolase